MPDHGPALVFVTTFDHYALPAFDAAARDYLLKPVEPDRLARAGQRLRERAVVRLPVRPERLLVTARGRTQVVTLERIEWLVAADNDVEIHAAGQRWLLRRTLTGLLADLGDGFVRIHRSCAVALAQVAELHSDARATRRCA